MVVGVSWHIGDGGCSLHGGVHGFVKYIIGLCRSVMEEEVLVGAEGSAAVVTDDVCNGCKQGCHFWWLVDVGFGYVGVVCALFFLINMEVSYNLRVSQLIFIISEVNN